MQRKTLYVIIGLIWLVLLVGAYASVEFQQIRDSFNYSDGSIEKMELMQYLNAFLWAGFWGIFSTALLLFTYDAVAILNHIDMKDEK